jgi:cell division protein FtsB
MAKRRTSKDKKKDVSREDRNTKAAMGLVLFLSVIFLLFTSLLGDKSLFQLSKMELEKDWWCAENTRQRDENKVLKSKILAARDDLFTVEMIAREELGLVKEDEVVYLFNSGEIRNIAGPFPGKRE